jgi:hypothetical protein
MVDMIVKVGDLLINIGEISLIENIKFNRPTSFTNFDEVLRIIFKSGKEELIGLSKKSCENLMEYYSSLCPNLDDDYTRKMMIQHIMNQRQQMVQQMMNEGKIPKTDFPDQTGPGMRGPAIR